MSYRHSLKAAIKIYKECARKAKIMAEAVHVQSKVMTEAVQAQYKIFAEADQSLSKARAALAQNDKVFAKVAKDLAKYDAITYKAFRVA